MKGIFFFAQLPSIEKMDQYFFNLLKTTLSINKHYLDETILYTTESTEVPTDLGVDKIVRLPSRHRHYPHYMRVMSWLAYLESVLFDADTVFLDADVVFHRRVDEAFNNNFALAFCATPSEKSFSNINAGCIFAKLEKKQQTIHHARKLLQIANEQRLAKDPRFPQFKTAGVWGVDEMCINTYLEGYARQKNTDFRQVALSMKFDDFIEFADDISLFGEKYNADPRKLGKSVWQTASILHFNGFQKKEMFEYCKLINPDS